MGSRLSTWRQFYFPPCAPELNPLEYVWGYLKTNPLANLACPEVGLLAATGRRHTRSLQHKPDLLRSFIRHSPLSLRLCLDITYAGIHSGVSILSKTYLSILKDNELRTLGDSC